MSNTIKVPADVSQLENVLGFVRQEMEAADAGMKSMMQVEVICEEIFTNIFSYAYADKDFVGEAEISCDVAANPITITVVFKDWGVEYNPLEKEDPDIDAAVEDRPIGGLGIFMTKKMMDEVNYEYKDGANILTLKKNIEI